MKRKLLTFYNRNSSILLLILLAFIICQACTDKLIVYPAPDKEPPSKDFSMQVNDRPVFVYQARVSKYPINQIWPGYQRPKEQTEIASFAYFDFKGKVKVKITSEKEIRTLDIRPKKYGIIPEVKGRVIEFELTEPRQFTVEVNGYHYALHIFANPVEKVEIDNEDPDVHYFGPGIHHPGLVKVKSNETVYIAGGAVVYGVIYSEDAKNIKIAGRGILDASNIKRGEIGETGGMIGLNDVKNSSVSGIILRDSPGWAVVPANCDDINFDNLKLIGLWRYNNDGIDFLNCKNIELKNSFIRSFDDNVVIKGLKRTCKKPYNIIENIKVDNCVLWNDWGRALEIGASTFADTIKNITYSNCQIPHFATVALDIQSCAKAHIKDIFYENIDIESPFKDSLIIGTTPIIPEAWGKLAVLGLYISFYSKDTILGGIQNIHFTNINYDGFSQTDKSIELLYDSIPLDKNPSFKNYDIFIRDNIYFGDIRFICNNQVAFYFSGYNNQHTVDNVHIKNCFLDGQLIKDIKIVGKNEFVGDVLVE